MLVARMCLQHRGESPSGYLTSLSLKSIIAIVADGTVVLYELARRRHYHTWARVENSWRGAITRSQTRASLSLPCLFPLTV